MYKKERYIITYIKFGTMNSKSHVSFFIKKKNGFYIGSSKNTCSM